MSDQNKTKKKQSKTKKKKNKKQKKKRKKKTVSIINMDVPEFITGNTPQKNLVYLRFVSYNKNN